MTSTLIAIDPGKISGYAVFDTSGDEPKLVRSLELDVDELGNELREELIRGISTDTLVVFEEFKITPQTAKNTNAPWSLENIGMIKYLCRHYGVTWAEQGPAAAKSFATNERLRKLGFWHVGGEGHANDAIRHAVLYMVQKMHWKSRDLLL